MKMPRRSLGFSLIELMVAMAIALVVTMAIFSVLTASEGRKRTTTSVNDVNQTGAYVSLVLDKNLRSAGSGFAQRWREAFGCRINASRSGTGVILPRAAALPAPFAAVSGSFRLAPVVIAQGQSAAGSDVLIVMSGTSGFSESPSRVLPGSATGDSLRLPNTLGLNGSDLVLVSEDGLGCLVEEVNTPFTGSDDQYLPFGGTYYTATGTDANLSSFATTGTAFAIPIGNSATNPPQFTLYGVGADRTLFSYDILRTAGSDAAMPVAEGVVEMRALYGLDSDGNRALDTWADPGSGAFDVATLLNGSAASGTNLRRIVAIRVALILRTSLAERGDPVAPTTLTLFQDMDPALQQTRTLTADERRHRHRVVEATIPLRNILLLQ